MSMVSLSLENHLSLENLGSLNYFLDVKAIQTPMVFSFANTNILIKIPLKKTQMQNVK